MFVLAVPCLSVPVCSVAVLDNHIPFCTWNMKQREVQVCGAAVNDGVRACVRLCAHDAGKEVCPEKNELIKNKITGETSLKIQNIGWNY